VPGNSFEDRRDAAVLAVLPAAGIRVSELAAIRYCREAPDRSDVDLEAREVRARGKGGAGTGSVPAGQVPARAGIPSPRYGWGVNNRGPLNRREIYQLVAPWLSAHFRLTCRPGALARRRRAPTLPTHALAAR
jgi:hypothetical protein